MSAQVPTNTPTSEQIMLLNPNAALAAELFPSEASIEASGEVPTTEASSVEASAKDVADAKGIEGACCLFVKWC